MIANKAIYINGPEGSGKTTAAGALLDPLWELNICKLVLGDSLDEIATGLQTAIRNEKKYIHLDHFPGLTNQNFLQLLQQALEKQITVIITSQAPPPKQIWGLIFWLRAEPYPYRETSLHE